MRGAGHVLSADRPPRHGEFFAPLPLAAVALLLVNDRWLKPALHSGLTGKLSDVALCFFMPLFVSECLGLLMGMVPRTRLALGAVFTAALYAALEVVPPFTAWTLRVLAAVGPSLGIWRPFRMTSDVTDLYCLALVPVAVWYGHWRLRRLADGAQSPS
jgi:hypothetical protein